MEEGKVPPQRYLSITDACLYMKTSTSVVQGFIATGQLRGIRITPKRFLLDIRDIDNLMSNLKEVSNA